MFPSQHLNLLARVIAKLTWKPIYISLNKDLINFLDNNSYEIGIIEMFLFLIKIYFKIQFFNYSKNTDFPITHMSLSHTTLYAHTYMK